MTFNTDGANLSCTQHGRELQQLRAQVAESDAEIERLRAQVDEAEQRGAVKALREFSEASYPAPVYQRAAEWADAIESGEQ